MLGGVGVKEQPDVSPIDADQQSGLRLVFVIFVSFVVISFHQQQQRRPRGHIGFRRDEVTCRFQADVSFFYHEGFKERDS